MKNRQTKKLFDQTIRLTSKDNHKYENFNVEYEWKKITFSIIILQFTLEWHIFDLKDIELLFWQLINIHP